MDIEQFKPHLLGRTIVDYFPSPDISSHIQGVIQLDNGASYLFKYRTAGESEIEYQEELPLKYSCVPMETWMGNYMLNKVINVVMLRNNRIHIRCQGGLGVDLAEKGD